MAKKMKISPKLVKYLEAAGVKHEILEHRTVYSALDAAATMKKKLNEIAKSLLVKADQDYYLVLLPADHNLDLEKLKTVLGKAKSKTIKVIKIPGEKIIENALKLKVFTISAFGNLHKIGVVMDKKIEKLTKAVFAAGSTNHSIEMAVKDFIKLEGPILGNFSIKKKIIKPKNMAKKVKAKAKKTKKACGCGCK
jgi:Ala-tRNA(Pro) deacylase